MPRGTVLVIDDDSDIRTIIRMILEEEGYRVQEAVGADAVNLAREEQPGVILLDVKMPQIDGIEISRLLRGSEITAHIPIICLAGELARAIREGMVADEWLAKPFRFDQLCDAVARWVERPVQTGSLS